MFRLNSQALARTCKLVKSARKSRVLIEGQALEPSVDVVSNVFSSSLKTRLESGTHFDGRMRELASIFAFERSQNRYGFHWLSDLGPLIRTQDPAQTKTAKIPSIDQC